MKLILGLLISVAFLTSGAMAQNFSCSVEKKCGQMRSCSEAVYQLRQCGYSKRDGDNDGIPCKPSAEKQKRE